MKKNVSILSLLIICTCSALLADSYSPSRTYANGKNIYVSAQYPINLSTGRLIEGTVQDATNKVVDNLSSVLRSQDFSTKDIVNLTVYLSDIRDYDAVDQVLSQRFKKPYPARTVIEAGTLLYAARIAISCDASKQSCD